MTSLTLDPSLLVLNGLKRVRTLPWMKQVFASICRQQYEQKQNSKKGTTQRSRNGCKPCQSACQQRQQLQAVCQDAATDQRPQLRVAHKLAAAV